MNTSIFMLFVILFAFFAGGFVAIAILRPDGYMPDIIMGAILSLSGSILIGAGIVRRLI